MNDDQAMLSKLMLSILTSVTNFYNILDPKTISHTVYYCKFFSHDGECTDLLIVFILH